ncbi:hypothetical protein ACHQM5_003238 [Ranunculus cassubicifolius]
MDRISYMPELIQSHIVSFLPLKQAIRTSILSRRWRDICSCLSNLDFDQLNEDVEGKNVKDIIDHTLFLIKGANLQSCKLDVEVDSDHISPLHFNRWVSFALGHNVKELGICLSVEGLVLLPRSLFIGSCLTTLELCGFSLKLPTIASFPVLKKLTLINMTFLDEYLTNKLFSDSSCPMLESLEMFNCYLDHFTTLSISATNLKNLNILIDIHDIDINFNLSNPNLEYIFYENNRLPEISLETLSSLRTATFEICLPPTSSLILENLACKILLGMHNVNLLRLRGHFIQFLTRVPDLLACVPTSYCCLKSLWFVLDPTKHQLKVITLLLRSYPNLQKLCVCFYEEDYTIPDLICMDENWLSKDFPSGDVLKHLTTVEFDCIRGSESEVEFVSYLLENAIVLEEMKISFLPREEITLETQMRVCQKLLTVARVSTRARIFLS